jgi:amino acid adenylation domain-containing protein
MSLNTPGFEAVDFDPFGTPAKQAPTTEALKELFTSVMLGGEPANCSFNESVSILLSGRIDRKLLKEAFAHMIERHEALRMTFSDDGQMVNIAPSITTPWTEEQFEKDREEEMLERHTRLATTTPFDLINGPLIRAVLLSFGDERHALIVTGHHLVCDGWSLALIMRDLSLTYTALVRREPVVLEPAVSFVNYANDQQRYNQSITRTTTEEFWQRQYRGDIPVVEFPTDFARPAFRTFHARRIDVVMPAPLVESVKQTSRKMGLSFVNFMLATFEAYLYRITGQDDLVVGLAASGQSAEGLYNLVGHCVNLLPLRTQVKPGMSFTDYAKERRKYLFDALDNQRFTYGSLLQKLQIPRDPSRIPLVPIAFNVDLGFTDGFVFEGCQFECKSNPRYFENFEVFLNAFSNKDEVILECSFNTDLFDSDIMELRMKEYITLMESVVKDPTQSIATLNILPEEEKEFLADINNTNIPTDAPWGVHERIDIKANELGDEVTAVVAGDNKLSYRKLKRLSSGMACRMQHLGVQPGDFIGVCMPRQVELPAVLLGVMKAGAAYVPMDHYLPADRLHYMMEDSGARYVVTTREIQEKAAFPAKKVLFLDELLANTNDTAYTKIPVDKNTLSYILYTSGSTGKPKAVAARQSSLVNLLVNISPLMGIGKDAHFLAITTISFDASVLELIMPLLTGATLHLATREQSIDPDWMDPYIESRDIRFMFATPATFDLMLSGGWQGKKNLSIIVGGEGLRTELNDKLLQYNREVWNIYGPTETTIFSTTLRLTRDDPGSARNGIITIGKPVANTRIYIMDANGQQCPIGVKGELWIAGEGVSAGYHNRTELTREKFIPSPDGNGMAYRSGDGVMVGKDGMLYFVNRLDNQVKVRGYRIELGEIETALSSCPGISQAVVMTRPDPSGQNMLAAWFVPDNPSIPEPDMVNRCRKHLALSLPEYMIPVAWKQMESFPLSANGKINRKVLPEPGADVRHTETEGPQEDLTPMQSRMIRLWEQLLQRKGIRLDDNYFELGGHSILAVKMVVDMEKETGIRLPLAVLFTNPTVRKLSALYEQPAHEADVWSPIVPIRTNGKRNPLFFAHGVSGNVFKYHAVGNLLQPDQPSYGIQAFGLNGTDTPFRKMEEMAAYHVDALLKFQPRGPYFLAGGSFGGYLAYEMAQQLTAQGHKVAFLALMDIEAAKKQDFLPSGVKQIVGAGLLAERFVKRAASLAMADKEERRQYFEARKRQKDAGDLESWLDRFKVTEMIGAESATFFKRVEDACHEAVLNYKIRPYHGPVLLVRAEEGYFNNEYDETLGWNKFASQLRVITVPGDHVTIFHEPHVEHMARELDKILEQAHATYTNA